MMMTNLMTLPVQLVLELVRVLEPELEQEQELVLAAVVQTLIVAAWRRCAS